MDIATALLDGWSLAAQRPAAHGMYRMAPIEEGALRLGAIITPEGDRGLLVGLAEGDRGVPESLRPRPGAKLAAVVENLSAEGAKTRALVIWFSDGSLQEAFLGFCGALVERVAGGVPVLRALERCYLDFRRLLAGHKEVERSRIVGLVGELLVLADLSANDPMAAMSWVGPEGGRHDFRRGKVAIEVKTSLRQESQSFAVRIAAIDQLEPPEGGTLYLHAVKLEMGEGAAVSVSSLLGAIRASASPQAMARVEWLMESLNVPLDLEAPRFTVGARRTYEVRPDFPRLTNDKLVAGRLDPGLSHVSYELDLAHAEQWRVVGHVLNSILAEPGNGS